MGIVEFIEARLAEAEAGARAVIDADYSEGRWSWREGTGSWREGTGKDVTLVNERGWPLLTIDGERVTYMITEHIAAHDPHTVLAEVAFKREILEQHRSWPVLASEPPSLEPMQSNDPSEFRYQMTQRMRWLTTADYVKHFGTEPPVAPMIRKMAAIWADHPDYDQEWGSD